MMASASAAKGKAARPGLLTRLKGQAQLLVTRARALTRRQLLMGGLAGLFALGLLGACYFIFTGGADYLREIRHGAVTAGLHALEEGDVRKAESVLMKAANKGNTAAAMYMAWVSCRTGNFKKALEYARISTSNGENYAVYEIMGDLALLGYGKAIGAGPALFYFGDFLLCLPEEEHLERTRMMIEHGITLAQNQNDYVRLVNAGARAFSPLAILLEGDIEFLAQNRSLSPTSALRSWELAERERVPEAITRRAGLLWNGYGIARDFEQAEQLYESANKAGDPLAGYFLGLIKLRSNEPDAYAQAMRLWRSAGRRGNPEAMTAVALMSLWSQRDDPEVVKNAASLLEQAAAAGDSCATIFYSIMLYNGDGVEQDREEAVARLFDLKARNLKSIDGMLHYLSRVTNEQSLRALFDQLLELVVAEYDGQLHFKVGDPVCDIYHLNKSSINYFTPSFLDEAVTPETRAKLGRNFIDRVVSPADVRIRGLPLIFPEMTEVLVYSEPSTGAKLYEPQRIITLKPEPPPLPDDFKGYEFDWMAIKEAF